MLLGIIIGKATESEVVCLNWSGGLRMAHFNIDKGGTDLNFEGTGHNGMYCSCYDQDSSIDWCWGTGRIKRFHGIIAKEVVAGYMRSCFGCREVRVITMHLQDHITCIEFYC